jgi:hypothetical protein
MKFIYKKDYLKNFKKFSKSYQKIIIEADKQIRHYYTKRKASYGLRIKKLYEKKGVKIFEARASLKVRIVWLETKEEIIFAIVGDHKQVYEYIKSF